MSDDLDRTDNTRLSVLYHKVYLTCSEKNATSLWQVPFSIYVHHVRLSHSAPLGAAAAHISWHWRGSWHQSERCFGEESERTPWSCSTTAQPVTRRATTACDSFLKHVHLDSTSKNGSSKRPTAAFICLFRLKLKQGTVCLTRAPSLITSSGESSKIFSWNDSVRRLFRVHSIPSTRSPDQTPWKISWLLINWL